jgi:autotransporter-associated beta strand protein
MTASVVWSGNSINTVNDGGSVTDGHIAISGGTNTVEGGAMGGVIHLLSSNPSTGLQMTGGTLTLNSDNAVAGKLLVEGDVNSFASATTSVITSGGSAMNFGNVDLNGGTRLFVTQSGSVSSSGSDLRVSAQIVNGGLTKTGTGILEVSGANTYAGGTIISAGTLLVSNSTGSGTGTGAITVTNSGTLKISNSASTDHISDAAAISMGGGTIAIATGVNEGSAVVMTAGTPTGANAAGLGALTLTASSTLNFGSGSTLLVFDSLIPAGFTLNITGYANAGFDGVSSSGTATDDRLVFAQDPSTNISNGAFNFGGGTTAMEIALSGGFWEVGFVATPVPEPSTWVTALLSAGAIGWSQRRRLRGLLKRP